MLQSWCCVPVHWCLTSDLMRHVGGRSADGDASCSCGATANGETLLTERLSLGAGVTPARATAAWLRDYITAIKHGQWHPYTPLERRVREATRNEAWCGRSSQICPLSLQKM